MSDLASALSPRACSGGIGGSAVGNAQLRYLRFIQSAGLLFVLVLYQLGEAKVQDLCLAPFRKP